MDTITADTVFAEMVTQWLGRLRREQRLENTTINEYERVLRRLVVPALGSTPLAQLTTDSINTVLKELGDESVNRQRKAKVVTGAMLDAAVECGALASNPVRGSMRISRSKDATPSLTDAELDRVRAAVRAWMTEGRPGPKASCDMADMIELMLATGARIGELLALRWSDVDFDACRVSICGTIKTETSKGTYWKPLPVSRVVALRRSVVPVLHKRRTRGIDNPIDAVFPTRNGTWQQVNNVERRWRHVRKYAGLDWVTPESFRDRVERRT
jgi:integrase